MKRRFGVRLAVMIALGGSALYGLDPNRTLTQYVHRIWQVQQGLPESSIYSVLQAHDGYLWLGTLTGLVRFDGVRFTTLEDIYPRASAAGLGNAWIRAMLEDSQGALWIGTNESGLFRLANGEVIHYTQQQGLPSDSVQCLTAQKDASGMHSGGPRASRRRKDRDFPKGAGAIDQRRAGGGDRPGWKVVGGGR